MGKHFPSPSPSESPGTLFHLGVAGAHHRQDLVNLKEDQEAGTLLLFLFRRVGPAAQGVQEVGILLLPILVR